MRSCETRLRSNQCDGEGLRSFWSRLFFTIKTQFFCFPAFLSHQLLSYHIILAVSYGCGELARQPQLARSSQFPSEHRLHVVSEDYVQSLKIVPVHYFRLSTMFVVDYMQYSITVQFRPRGTASYIASSQLFIVLQQRPNRFFRPRKSDCSDTPGGSRGRDLIGREGNLNPIISRLDLRLSFRSFSKRHYHNFYPSLSSLISAFSR